MQRFDSSGLMSKLHVLVFAFVALIFSGCQSQVDNSDIASLPRISLSEAGTSFSLADIDGLKFVNADSVPWAGYMQETPENGQIAYFFVKGHDIQLASPHVRLEYISKSLPNCESEEALIEWIKSYFVTPERKGKVIGEGEIQTLDAKTVKITEIAVPNQQVDDSLTRSRKYMAWAYVEDGNQFVGFNFTSVDSASYGQEFGKFQQLVRSFKAE